MAPTLLPQPLCAAGLCCVATRGRYSPRTCPHLKVWSPSLRPPARQLMGRHRPSVPPPLAPRARLGSPLAATLLPSISLTPVAPSTHHWGDGWPPCHGPGYLRWLKGHSPVGRSPPAPHCPGAGPWQLFYLCSSFTPSQWPRLPESGRGDGHSPVPPEAKWLRVAEDRWDGRNDSRKTWPQTQA